jgi:formylmethanofuran dehydrogenase subunit E
MNLPDSMIQQAAAFHGHLGPYLIIGLRMGLLATSLLDGDPFSIRAEIHTQKTPPKSCILDGVQFSSGCTLGKGNIHVQNDSTIYGVFSKGSTSVQIRVKEEVLSSIPAVPREELHDFAHHLSAETDTELFDVIV